jgi:AraC family transcriptional regulator, transcriptional activator FtrA
MPTTRGPALSRGRTKHVIGIVVVPDTLPLELLVAQAIFGPPLQPIADIMGVAEEAPYDVVLVGEQTGLDLARGIGVTRIAPLDALADVDTVLVPGVAAPFTPRSADLLDAIRAAGIAGARMVSFCGGAFVLAQAGVLDGRAATTHWLLSREFRTMFPRVRLDADRLYIDDPPVYTSGGILAATDLALHLLALDRGQTVANDVARVLVSAPHRNGGQAQFIKEELRSDSTASVDSLLCWIRDNLSRQLTLADIARHAHVSERSVTRRFRDATGCSALEWIAHERVNRAKVLLETTEYAVSDIAVMVGFGSRETLRRNFERIVGTTAGQYRRAFLGDDARGPGPGAR